MNKHTIILVIILLNIKLFAQVQMDKNQNNIYKENENYIKTYRIFPTVNMSYFIKLNTRTGQMWLIKFDQKKTTQLEIPLNNSPLVEKQKEVDNRFKLFPTQNSWNFLLLDQINGKIWQVNWDIKPKKNKISSINNSSLTEKKAIINNRFTIYPTRNSWIFLLLNKVDGSLWQINWSTKSAKGEIISINK